jgi:hypothetical protein
MKDWFEPLDKKDIEEKIKLNAEKGMTLQQLKNKSEQELFAHEREILTIKFEFTKLNWFAAILKLRNYWKILLPYEIQAQNLREQIAYMEEKRS